MTSTAQERTEDPAEQAFTIPARSTRGWVLGVTGRQLCSLALALSLVVGGIYVHYWWSVLPSILLAGVLVILTWVPLGGRKLGDWVPIMVSFGIRRARRWTVYRGGPFAPGGLSVCMDLPGSLTGCEWVYATGPDGVSVIGLVRDRVAKTLTACLPTYGSAFALEESSVQAARLDDWESVLDSFADPDSGLVRWQLLIRSRPDSGNRAQRYFAEHATDRDSRTARSLQQLNAAAAPDAQRHEVYVVVTYSIDRLHADLAGSKDKDADAIAMVVEQLVEMEHAIREAQIRVDADGWMSPARYAAVIKSQFDPESLPLFDLQAATGQSFDERNAGPTGADTSWEYYLHESGISQTVWVHDLPRRVVHRNWLAPLLQQNTVRRTVSIVAEPFSEERAQRHIATEEAERAGNEMIRARLGFGATARSVAEERGVAQIAAEMTTGSPLMRYHMFVTVTAADVGALRRDMVTIRRRLTRAHCHGMPLYGEMDQAFYAGALPLARGLAPMRGLIG